MTIDVAPHPVTQPVTQPVIRRQATARRYLMCRPSFFDVTYQINPWMDPTAPVDRERAIAEWEALRDSYRALGHTVDEIDPVEGLPDMVFAANGGVVLGDRALAAHFTHPQRAPEAGHYRRWFERAGFDVAEAAQPFEGEGDVLVVGDRLLAGTGFRTTPAAHAEFARFFGRPVESLTLVDPRFYHLDTALAVLDAHTIAYYPAAFDAASRARLEQLFPDAIQATEPDALAFGLNAVSDGRHVHLAAGATGLIAALAERDFEPIAIETGELLKAGGSVKCCTLEVHR